MYKCSVLGMSMKLCLHSKSWPQLAGPKILSVADIQIIRKIMRKLQGHIGRGHTL